MFQHRSKLIWTFPEDCGKDIYRVFRKRFPLPELNGKSYFLDISADSFFEVFLNGIRISVTAFSDHPEDRTYSRINIKKYLRSGENMIAVRVHYLGENFSTYRTGKPYLRILVHSGKKCIVKTDSGWKCAVDPEYCSGKQTVRTVQMGYVFEYHSLVSSWKDASFDDSTWKNAQCYSPEAEKSWTSFSKRPVRELREQPFVPGKLLKNAFLQRNHHAGTAAECCEQDRILNKKNGGSGSYYLFDLGAEYTGYLQFRVRAKAGTILDIAHGEHIHSGRLRTAIEGRNFADRYICRGGSQEFTHTLRRIAARYLEVHVPGEAEIEMIGIIPVVYPLPETTPVKTGDAVLERLNKLSINTLTACMHEHYEDCPWREQALYACDSRNQMLFGYQIWGNYKFAKASLDLLAKSLRPDGYLELCAPAKVPVTIPVFSFAWIASIKEYILYSGDLSAAKRYAPVYRTVLENALCRKSKISGLFEPLKNGEIWNFYEWNGELSGGPSSGPDILYNLYLLEALRAGNTLAEWNNTPSVVSENVLQTLENTIEREFRDESSGCYLFRRREDQTEQQLYEHVQILMLYSGIVPEKKRLHVETALLSGELAPVTYSVLPYWIRTMMDSDTLRTAVLPRLKKMFRRNLDSDSTTLWEHPDGADWIPAASLCHAWSSASVLYSGAFVLGVTPLQPGFKKFLVKPYPGSLDHAKGEIPTPHGKIRIEWYCRSNEIELNIQPPPGTEWEYECFSGYKINLSK